MNKLYFRRVTIVFLFVFSFSGVGKLSAQDTSPQFIQGNDTLVVYKDVPTLVSSDKYTIRVRSAATNNEWVDVFANYTYNRGFELGEIPRNDGSNLITVIQGYQKHTNRWSHTFGNIEMNEGQAIEVEIAAKNGLTIGGQNFFKATVHPSQKASLATVIGGKIYFTITKPAQVVIDINGQMDDYNAAINGGIGHPIHAISLFANPVIKKPSITDSRVRIIDVGTSLAAINAINPSDYDTMYFKPGVHDIGSGIKIYPGKSIYIPGDALVYGTFDNQGVSKGSYSRSGENITIFGYGTISGQKIPHYQYAYYYPNISVTTDRVITIDDAINYKLYGITTIDNANHTTSIFSYGGGSIKWWKTITWRANGDGIGDYGDVEDCFIRTADDCSYVKGNRRRCTFWKDANAALFHMATIPENRTTPLYIEDCDFIYTRLRTAVAFNGGGFQQRGEGTPGQRNVNVVARNLRFHDKLINMPIFSLVSGESGSSYDGILFQNITIGGMAPGNKQRILGSSQAPWYGGIIFDNLTIGGTLVTSKNASNYFTTNEFVKDIWYQMPEYYSVSKNVNPAHGSITVTTTDTSEFAIRTSDTTYLEKSTVVFSASAIPGYKFTSWSGDVISTTNPLSVEMNSNKNITANFEYVGFRVLTVTSSGNGTVVTNPTSTNHTLNSIVTITAKAAIGYKFKSWSGDLINQDIITTIVMDADKTVVANFVKTNDFAVNYGGDQYIAVDGTVYAAGSNQSGTTFTTSTNITNTADPVLYQSEKFGSSLTYNYPVENGKYDVTLKFAELSAGSSSARRFNATIEGIQVLSNFHLSVEAGGNFIAIDKTFQTTVSDGNLNINLARVSSATNNAKISAIKITRIPDVIPIFDLPAAPYCAGEILMPLPTTSTNGITGTWSPALNNLATTEYTFTPNAGQFATIAKLTITVNPNVIPIFTLVSAICLGTTLSDLPITSDNGITGTWSPAIDNTETTTYTFTPTDGLCATTGTMTITVNRCSQTFCYGARVSNLTPSGADIKWYSSTTAKTPLASTALLTTKTYFYTQTLGTVVSDRISENVVINPTSIAGSISGASGAICYNTGKKLTLSATHRGNVQWQSTELLTDGLPVDFVDIVGETANTLNTGNLTVTTYFRAVLTNGLCLPKNTTSVKVNVRAQSMAGTIAASELALCSGKNSTLMTLTGRLGRIQWHSSTDNLNYTSLYPYGTTSSFRARNLASTTFYKAVVTNGTGCTSALSDAVVLNVKPVINPGTISGTSLIPYNTRTTLEIIGHESESTLSWRYSRTLDGVYVNGVQPIINNTIYTTPKLLYNVYFKAMTTKDGCSSFTEPYLIQIGSGKFSSTVAQSSNGTFDVIAYPNPFVNKIKLYINSSSKAPVALKVYDLLGRLIEVRHIKSFEMDNQDLGNGYPSGTYNVILRQDSNLKTLRLIKR